MAGRTRAAENAYLEHMLNNASFLLIGDTLGLLPSAVDGDLFVSLHTASPTDTGNQTSFEAAFQNYARKAITRDGSGWSVSAGQATNSGAVTFLAAGSGPAEVITHVGIGTALSGTGFLVWFGSLTPSRTVDNGDTVEFAIGALTLDATTLEL